MKSVNFPAKVFARRQGALARLKGPVLSDPIEQAAALERYNQEKTSLVKATTSIFGDPRNLRSKKDRSDRAKIR